MSFLGKFRTKKFPLVGLVLTGILIGFGLAFLGFSLTSHGPDLKIRAETPGIASDQSPEVGQAITQATSVQSAFRYVAQTVLPSVVEIDVTSTKKASDSTDQQNPWKYFFGQPEDGQGAPDKEYQEEGLGSGIIVRRDGKTVYVLTNNHVAGDADKDGIKVILVDGREFPATLVGADTRKDIAVVKFETDDKDIVVAKLGNSSALEVGDWAIAVGNPFGFSSSVTIGVVSAIGRTGGPDDNISDFIQTDAAINKGNSGGALVNIRGEVVGMNTWIASPTGGSIGLGFAIASNLVKQVSDALIKNGEVIRPFIGVAMQELTPEIGSQFGADYGVIVSEVIPGESAEKAGIKTGDVIQKIGGKKIHSPHELLLAVTSYQPGDKIEVVVKRDGKEHTFTLIAGQREGAAIARTDEGTYGRQGGIFNQLGLCLKVVEEQLVIQEVRPDGAVAKAADSDAGEIRPGDIIHEVNRIPVKSVTEFVEALDKTRNNMVIFYIERFSSRQGSSFRFFLPVQVENQSK